MILDIIYGVHQIIFAVFKPSQSGIATITNVTAYIACVMVVICNNFCRNTNNRAFSERSDATLTSETITGYIIKRGKLICVCMIFVNDVIMKLLGILILQIIQLDIQQPYL